MPMPQGFHERLRAMAESGGDPADESVHEPSRFDRTPEPEPEPAPSDDEPAPPPDVPETVAVMREQLAAERAQREALERQAEFLRQGSQPVAAEQVDPVAQVMNLLQVDEETWTEMLADPKRGALIASQALQRVAQIAIETARAQARTEAQQYADQRVGQMRADMTGQELHQQFWARNGDLSKYQSVVKSHAADLAAEQPSMRRSGPQIVEEIGRRTRAELRGYGIQIEDPAPATGGTVTAMAPARQRLRPAQAEMAGGGGRGPRPLTPIQKQLEKLTGRRLAG